MFDSKIKESINKLRRCSSEFINFYKNNSLDDAKRVSEEALKCFDFIGNEILRIRDDRKKRGVLKGSGFERSLNTHCGKEYKTKNATKRNAIITTPILPVPNTDIRFVDLITKLKHHENANFRIEPNNSHIIIFSIRKFIRTPASIVEFDVEDYCQKAENVANYI